ncbi:ORF63 [Xestia c-nigrum granulovirus]|jgi:hypothetical protein|uniref:Maco-A 94/2 34 n=2 Tax=Baculoviridae TaxID=10442 RepID=A0A7G7Y812_NPVMC|nr:ORF63 [Xestia c-nigrum granulovirus]AAF05177.1 ORF63 [Xestia c-nigrum granulovirus]QNH90508.1 maco-A 94/2 34 [Mamestra configurata nucleopolyhedrovirus A]
MGCDGYIKVYFFDEQKKVIKRIELHSHKYLPVSEMLDIMPEAKFVKVCFDDDNNSCECDDCNDADESESEEDNDED